MFGFAVTDQWSKVGASASVGALVPRPVSARSSSSKASNCTARTSMPISSPVELDD
jgi:hypothetical protein